MGNKVEELNGDLTKVNGIITKLKKLKSEINTKIKPKALDMVTIYNRSITSEIIDNWKGTAAKDFNGKSELTKGQISSLDTEWNDLITIIDKDIGTLREEVVEIENSIKKEENNG